MYSKSYIKSKLYNLYKLTNVKSINGELQIVEVSFIFMRKFAQYAYNGYSEREDIHQMFVKNSYPHIKVNEVQGSKNSNAGKITNSTSLVLKERSCNKTYTC
jgi:hypothetical protein